jgi:NifB/MoaA-like Fe-S oxidoreductase
LSVSLHAIDSEVRLELMGKNHARGLAVLEALLQANIQIHAQIVLVPGINDGKVLERTLDWCLKRPGITVTGIVPYGYTRYAKLKLNFTQAQCRELCINLESLAPKIQLADEFYLKAWPESPMAHIPSSTYYNDYPLVEDGIGMIRQYLETNTAGLLKSPQPHHCGRDPQTPDSLAEILLQVCNDDSTQPVAPACPSDCLKLIVTGEAFAPILRATLPRHPKLEVIAIKNHFFGGNVNVAGLLTATDVIQQISHHLQLITTATTKATPHAASKALPAEVCHIILPKNMFNDDGLTLDDYQIEEIATKLGCTVTCESNPDINLH